MKRERVRNDWRVWVGCAAVAAAGGTGVHALILLSNDNFQDAVDACLAEDATGVNCPVTAANYGQMADWDTSAVRYMSSAFARRSEFNADLSRWNTSRVENMNSMFDSALAFNRDLSEWDTGRVMDMSSMFYQAEIFDCDLSGWETGEVTNMQGMFHKAFSPKRRKWRKKKKASEIATSSPRVKWLRRP